MLILSKSSQFFSNTVFKTFMATKSTFPIHIYFRGPWNKYQIHTLTLSAWIFETSSSINPSMSNVNPAFK